jgi:hypothetical protein
MIKLFVIRSCPRCRMPVYGFPCFYCTYPKIPTTQPQGLIKWTGGCVSVETEGDLWRRPISCTDCWGSGKLLTFETMSIVCPTCKGDGKYQAILLRRVESIPVKEGLL